MMAVANRLFPVVPDTGTEKAARLAAEHTGSPGCWVRLDCGHSRHTQQPVAPGEVLDCPTCPPSVSGQLGRRRVLPQAPERRLCARLAADPLAPTTARQLAAQAVTSAGLNSVATEVEQVVGELVANALGHTDAPLELTIDTRDDVVRVEIRDQAPSVALGLEEHPEGHGAASGRATTDRADRRAAGALKTSGTVVWAELRGGHAG
jgi:anti-sigma regulatory factor (Ser/Thr protein kinase)